MGDRERDGAGKQVMVAATVAQVCAVLEHTPVLRGVRVAALKHVCTASHT